MKKLYTIGVILFFLITTTAVATNWSNPRKSFNDFSNSVASDIGKTIDSQSSDAIVKTGGYLSKVSDKTKNSTSDAYDKVKAGISSTVEDEIIDPVHDFASYCVKNLLLNYSILTKDDVKAMVSKDSEGKCDCN